MNKANERPAGWDGYRTFVVARKEPESQTVTSFYLEPEDGKPIPAHKPGQFLGFKLNVPGKSQPVIRTYTISDCPGDGRSYRLSIKREPAPPGRPDLQAGLSSNYFHDHIEVGSTLQTRAPLIQNESFG